MAMEEGSWAAFLFLPERALSRGNCGRKSWEDLVKSIPPTGEPILEGNFQPSSGDSLQYESQKEPGAGVYAGDAVMEKGWSDLMVFMPQF